MSSTVRIDVREGQLTLTLCLDEYKLFVMGWRGPGTADAGGTWVGGKVRWWLVG